MTAAFRALWLAQHATGVMNGFFMLVNIDEGNWLSAAISAACLLFTASWRVLPPKGNEK